MLGGFFMFCLVCLAIDNISHTVKKQKVELQSITCLY